jgi:hypothetical protein
MCFRSGLVFVIAGTWLTACGGGGGNSAMMPAPAPFASFGAVKSGQPVQASGISQTVNATTTLTGNVTSTTLNAVDTTNSSATLTYGVIPTMTAFSFSTPISSVTFSGSSVQCGAGTGVCGASSGNAQAVVVNPLDPRVPAVPELAWNYQSFGYWLVAVSSTSTVAGAMSFGNPTPAGSIPANGTATYHGLSTGFYVDQTGALFVHGAKMQSIVDFGPARSVTFSTSQTTISPINVASPIPASPALDLNGSLFITPGTNQFSGQLNAPGGMVGGVATPAMVGTATGRFYGPAVGPAVPAAPAEISGVFSLKGTGPQTMLGGFGGKQP